MKKLLIVIGCVLSLGLGAHAAATGNHEPRECPKGETTKHSKCERNCEDHKRKNDKECKPPVDVCKNLPGVQSVVPKGMTNDQEGVCKPLVPEQPQPTPQPDPQTPPETQPQPAPKPEPKPSTQVPQTSSTSTVEYEPTPEYSGK